MTKCVNLTLAAMLVLDLGGCTGGVMMTPALDVDGQIKVVGKVPDAEAIKAFLG